MGTLARSFLVMGSNRGIGLELVRQLATSPRPLQHIFATCHDATGPRGKAEDSSEPGSTPSPDNFSSKSKASVVCFLRPRIAWVGRSAVLLVASKPTLHACLQALQELAARHPSIKLLQLADTVDLPSILGAVQAVESHLEGQGLNLLINNVGVGSWATLHSVDAQGMLATFAVNMVGPLLVVKAPLTVEHSMQGILEVLGSLSQNTSGAFLNWEGNHLPW
ncbi:hypothetical protein ASZ78_016418 [Callipepla squamata]|uniref:Ketoreductase (KR) domain-containing protein n=1 Tax=Callipepla squamata TaxID=9009 RepID=A0A226MPK0_CALSU|nr:hypothetical protein ASZ78_016418 [Callipepla squamata]